MAINKLILEKIKERDDKATMMTILYGIDKGCDLKLFRHCNSELRFLLERGLIEESNNGYNLVHSWQENEILNLRPANRNKKDPNGVMEWIHDWLKLFPKDLKSKGILPYSISGNTQACIDRMNRFMVRHTYSKKTIFEATELYLREQEQDGWHYTKKNAKFIYDTEGSVLEDYCDRIERGETSPQKLGHFRL